MQAANAKSARVPKDGTSLIEQPENFSHFRTREFIEDNIHKLPVWKGPFNVNCMSNKEPAFLMAEIAKTLDQLKISYQKQTYFAVVC